MASSAQFRQHAFFWKLEFSTRQTRIYETEDNKMTHDPEPRIVNGRKVYIFHTPQPSTTYVIERFINDRCEHDIKRYLYRKLQLTEFLQMADLAMLQNPSQPSMKPMVLIDDRNNVTGSSSSGNSREFLGPLTSSQFYRELSRKRIALPDHSDAERRLIYITDLDSLCVLTLAATASTNQCMFLRDFVYKNLARKTYLGVQIPSIGWPTFCLEFHLPYRAWRPMSERQKSENQIRLVNNMGRSHRRSEEVIPLGSGTSKAYIHEAQVSIMIVGLDDWFWTAYCFVDLYFQDAKHPEQVHNLANPPRDFHSGGKFDLNMPKWNPRHYFLQSLSSRVEQVKQEWTNTASQLFQDIDPCIYAFTRGETFGSAESQLEITQRPGFIWAIRVLRQFTHEISKITNAWDTFEEGEIRYFNNPGSEELSKSAWGLLLAAIDKNIIEMKDLRGSLLHRTDLFENMTNSIVTHAAHAETITTRLQSQFIQALTVITILYLPPSLASTVFSMQESIFGNSKFHDWLYTLIGLFVATLLLVLAVLALNNASVRAWPKNAYKAIIKALSGVLGSFRFMKRAFSCVRDKGPNAQPAGIEMDDHDDTDSPEAGEV